ncbi:MAG: hypothetical protein ACI8X5_000724 [Planctomycetota bacterium]|jgi:hypothetical protein
MAAVQDRNRYASLAKRWAKLFLILCALGLTLRGLALSSANSEALQFVLGNTFYLVLVCLLLGLACALKALGMAWIIARGADEPSGVAGSLRWAFSASIVSALCFIALVEPFQRLWFDLALGMGASGYSLLLVLERPLARRLGARFRVFEFLVFSLCVGALGLELGLRSWTSLRPSPLFARVGGGPSELVQRYRCEPGEVRFGFACNDRGFYDEAFYRKLDGEAKRIVAIGDSFGVGTVPHAWHYTTIAEELSGYRVDNMGVAGIGPPEYLSLLVQEALPLDPDLILISVFIGNDLDVEDTLTNLPDSGLRRWLQRDQVLLFVVPERLAKLNRERESSGKHKGSGSDSQAASAALPALSRAQAAEAFPWVADPSLEDHRMSPETFFGVEALRARFLCAQDPPSIELLRDSLLAARAAAGDIPLLVMLIPDEFQVEDELWNEISAASQRPLERDRAQRLLLPWLDQNSFPTLDLLPLLRDVPVLPDGKRHVYHAFDTHFNARGNEVTGNALAEFLSGY